ncbi:MAG: NAD(+) synthase [Desulfobacteraceae bacterium]|nr:NAD(+) synthase [Desulfobacteraceae bacterium]
MNTQKTIDHIVRWLKQYCTGAGLNGYVVGISGGIDSAVTSTLCARTHLPVIALIMPIYQHPDQVSLAADHADWLATAHTNVQKEHTDLSDPFSSLEKTLPAPIQDDLTMANTRSRLRMLALYAFAGHNRMLVAGTGNKVEDFGIGFYTKYGDGGVDISPIADLTKTEVYGLGEAMGIHEGILRAAPADGLWADNRTDESQIGATYAELEAAMRFEEMGGNTDQLGEREREVLSIYRKLNGANKHKMLPIPVCRIPEEFR